jgi:hypothetical protein
MSTAHPQTGTVSFAFIVARPELKTGTMDTDAATIANLVMVGCLVVMTFVLMVLSCINVFCLLRSNAQSR